MIIGIISGYYRSGTTIFQRIFEEALGVPVLHEPTQHEIIRHIYSLGFDKPHPMHGFDVFRGYAQIPSNVFNEFAKRHAEVFKDVKQYGVMTDFNAIKYLLQPFHECNVKIIVKANQVWLYLDKLAKEYNCWVIHLDRDENQIIAEHTTDKSLLLSDRYMPFYTHEVYNSLTAYLGVRLAHRRNIDKLRFIIRTVKKVVREQANKCDKIKVINFDDFAKSPLNYKNILGEKIVNKALELIDLNKITKVPDWLYKI